LPLIEFTLNNLEFNLTQEFIQKQIITKK
jgi:hypothetical protein